MLGSRGFCCLGCEVREGIGGKVSVFFSRERLGGFRFGCFFWILGFFKFVVITGDICFFGLGFAFCWFVKFER